MQHLISYTINTFQGRIVLCHGEHRMLLTESLYYPSWKIFFLVKIQSETMVKIQITCWWMTISQLDKQIKLNHQFVTWTPLRNPSSLRKQAGTCSCLVNRAAGSAPINVTYKIIQNIMKTFHRAMKIRKYRRLSRKSLMLSPGVEKDVTLFNAAQWVKVPYIFVHVRRTQSHLWSAVWTHLQSPGTPSFGYKDDQVIMAIITVVAIITTIKMNRMAPFWGNTHSLKFNTAPAFTNKVLQTQTQNVIRRVFTREANVSLLMLERSYIAINLVKKNLNYIKSFP